MLEIENGNQNDQTNVPESSVPNEGPQDAAPDSSDSLAPSSENLPQDLVDLDKMEKFRLHGEEWTRDKLASAMLRQADYTRKTQEIAKERKYYDNLSYDIANVLQKPELIAQFKKIYPEKFHKYLDSYSKFLPQTKSEAPKSEGQTNVDPQLLTRLEQVENRFREQEVKAADAMLDNIFKKYSSQYEFADEASVINKALTLMERKKSNGEKEDLSNAEWDALFKSEHERVYKLAEAKYKATTQKQLQANRKAKDVASGGGAPSQAPQRLSLKDATEAAIRDLTGR